MSNYGNPPTDPYGQPPAGQDPYGQPPQGSYGQDPYAQQNPYGAQPPAAYSGVPQGVTFAHWGKRVGATLIDSLILLAAYIPALIGAGLASDPGTAGMGTVLTLIGLVLYIGVFVWNVCIKQGSTGYTVGKGVMGIKLVKAETGLPIGGGMSFVRQLAHILDGLPCYLGFLWPLWDAKRQTFADKIIGTYVIDMPKS
jgi:uncharacterized RDD family membrane protein YckC